MKKGLLIIGLLLALTGCFGSEDGPPAAGTGYHSYSIENITVNIPDEWEVLTPKEFGSSVPPQTIVAFRSNLKNPYFTPNVTILRGPIAPNTTNSDYVKSLLHRIGTTLVSYRDLGSDAITLFVQGKNLDTTLLRSEGSEQPSSDLKYFGHVPAIAGDSVYTAVGTALATVDDADKEKMENIMKSLSIK